MSAAGISSFRSRFSRASFYWPGVQRNCACVYTGKYTAVKGKIEWQPKNATLSVIRIGRSRPGAPEARVGHAEDSCATFTIGCVREFFVVPCYMHPQS
ncbi:hypothetical protein NE237_005588 [Protea cynaroides]|uniref:Uncharacterized protein n=1 Tax=Protea cynaroides TaxID=273540 RepID=A0A9Q0GK77_9MAGN|nr:hypothetical protein NE237_005588 [Protea cynaroides]